MPYQTVKTNGIELRCAVAGKGELILFLHGFPETSRMWDAQLEHFSGSYLTVAPDLRGYNLSSKPNDVSAYRLPILVDDIKGLADHFGAEKIILVAHDWGGVVAWAFAHRYPERLKKLVIINAPHPEIFRRELQSNPAQQKASQYMQFFQSPRAEGKLLAKDCAGLLASFQDAKGRSLLTKSDEAAYREAWNQPGALTAMLNYYRAMFLGQSDEAIKNVLPFPVLVVWGEADRYLLPGNLQGLEQFMSDLTLVRLPGVSHWVAAECPHRLNREIEKFL